MDYAIKVSNLSKQFKAVKKEQGFWSTIRSLVKPEIITVDAVDNISFSIKEGEMIGFIGANGAGKTTTLKLLSGLIYPTSGDIDVLGFVPQKRKKQFLKQISLLMGQKNQLWWDLPAVETFDLNRTIYEIPKEQYNEVLNEMTELLDIGDVIKMPVRKLSLGQRMKCEFVASLLHTPKILFLDEPTIGLDVVMQKRIREFIKDYNKKYNATIILTSHYMDDVKEICDRVIFIHKGSILFDDKIDKLIEKYANYKLIIPTFVGKIERSELEKIKDCEIVEFDGHRAVLKVDRKKSSTVSARIHKQFDIDDLDINEPKLENVVRRLMGE